MTRSRKILIVDDGKDMAELIADIVQMNRFDPLVAFGAKEGLARLDGDTVIGAFVDMFMPDMDGIEFIRSVTEADASIPIVLMSGHDATFMRYAKEIGENLNVNVVGMLTKPFTISEVSEMIEKMIAHRRGRRSGAGANDDRFNPRPRAVVPAS